MAAAEAHPGKIAVHIGYDEALAHRIQAGSDALLVPSRFEPCGLTQLAALRYGAVPVVARVGGLSDTVIDANEMALTAGVPTGVQFYPATGESLAVALWRTARLFRDRHAWRTMQKNGMATDVSWHRPAHRYASLYLELRRSKAGPGSLHGGKSNVVSIEIPGTDSTKGKASGAEAAGHQARKGEVAGVELASPEVGKLKVAGIESASPEAGKLRSRGVLSRPAPKPGRVKPPALSVPAQKLGILKPWVLSGPGLEAAKLEAAGAEPAHKAASVDPASLETAKLKAVDAEPVGHEAGKHKAASVEPASLEAGQGEASDALAPSLDGGISEVEGAETAVREIAKSSVASTGPGVPEGEASNVVSIACREE